MRSLSRIIIGLLFISTLINAQDSNKYGKEISTKEKTNVSAILESPADFEGKTVLVEGTVVNVCAKMGCWIEVASDKEFETIRVKVDDGAIIFPMEAKGKTALVEGEVYSLDVETEKEYLKKEGEEKCSDEHKEKKEGEHKCATKEVKKVYQIKGLGAVIKG
ncbi:MAG: DUF4920 domain-containing protein [Bacteroidetes bacterium]|nr:DUF4920 domain-containing protein [Bacteroidota bacterium]MBU1678498.1 DUF4920 domain-containing protein [Bacteroidota bacterium]MBU2505199.1 DUF4920 domain-containing protein [Bacteroidota bacterium]